MLWDWPAQLYPEGEAMYGKPADKTVAAFYGRK